MPAPYLSAQRYLAAIDADWARLVAAVGDCAHAAKPAREPYEALVRAVAYQQLHARAAEAILARLLALFQADFPSPAALLATPVTQLRACGFSMRKIATLHAIAAGRMDGLVPSRDEAMHLDDEALVTRLVALPGIGRWTVEIMLIYTLAREDILPADDFGVCDGFRRFKGWAKAPTRKQMSALALPWSPYRTIAAWYLWRVPRDWQAHAAAG